MPDRARCETPSATRLSNDRIVFQIPVAGNNYDAATGSWTIVLNSPLPAISTPAITIDGLTQQSQPGAATTHPVVAITPGPRNTGNGLVVSSGGNTVRGLVIGGFQGAGMLVDGSGATGNLVTGNFIGTDVTGTIGRGNGFAGVRLGGTSNTVASNVISGGRSEGVFVTGRGDQVVNNLIGTDATGTAALGNGLSGITILQTANVLVRGNTISGNGVSQVGGSGIIINSASSDLIVGNFIGTDAAGTRRLPNFGDGVSLILGASGNTIGGADVGLGNIIANNRADGVLVDTGTGNVVLSNSIHDNVAGGIVLVNGGNNNQVSPILTSALVFPDQVRVEGSLAATADTGYLVQFFGNNPASGQGRTLLGSQTVPSQATNHTADLTLVVAATLPAGATITAVASVTSTPVESSNPAFGDTSAFSTAVVLVSPFVVTNTNDSGIGSLRFAIQSANGDVNNDDTITFRIPTQDPGFIPSTGSWTIPVLSLLAIAKPLSDGIQHVVVIDGLTQQSQPGAAATHPVVEITPGPRYTGNGLEVSSGGNTVRGLVIGGFQGAGMLVDGSGATGNLVTGNFIGTDVTGTTRLPNRFAGVRLGGSSNTVSSNLISGNTSEGVFVIGRGDQVLDNRIGTDAAGTAALGNGLSGITILQAANVLVRGNTISGNGIGQFQGGGIVLTGPGATDNLIVGNFIGTDSTGMRRIPNVADGITIFPGATGNTVGGTAAGARNVISGNGGNGLTIQGTSNNSVIGNDIGVGADGTTVLGNTFDGVFLSDAPSNVLLSRM